MSYRIEVEPAAWKELRALPGQVRAQAEEVIDELAGNSRPARAKELRDNPSVYRLWLAGRWRIVYEIDDGALVVYIIRIRRKEQIDYDSVRPREESDDHS